MTLTPDQFNKLALKEDLSQLATKEELHQHKDEILDVLDVVIKKLDNV